MRDVRLTIADKASHTVGLAAVASVVLAVRSVRKLGTDADKSMVVSAVKYALKGFMVAATSALVAVAIKGWVEGAMGRKRALRARANRERRFGLLDEAVSYAKMRADWSDEDIARVLEQAKSEVAVSMGNYAKSIEAKLRKAVSRGVGADIHVRDMADLVSKTLTKAGVTEKPYVVKQIARTQTNMSFIAGRLAGNEAPEIQEDLWGYRYVTVDDDRVRPSHAALDGVCLPKEHAFWKKHMPPNGYNCRCSVVEVWNDERPRVIEPPGAFEYEGHKIVPGADKGWGFNPLDTRPKLPPAPEPPPTPRAYVPQKLRTTGKPTGLRRFEPTATIVPPPPTQYAKTFLVEANKQIKIGKNTPVLRSTHMLVHEKWWAMEKWVRAKESVGHARYQEAVELTKQLAEASRKLNEVMVRQAPEKTPNCDKRRCRHYTGFLSNGKPACKAYPKGIPRRIAYGKDLHLEPEEGDHGITFEEKP